MTTVTSVSALIVVHAGNRVDAPDRPEPRLPAAAVPRLADRLGALLDLLQPEVVVTAAASGADLLLVEQAHARGIAVELVLPCPVDRFRDASVADQGERWLRSFDAEVRHARSDPRWKLVELGHLPDDEGFRAGNQALVDHARALSDRVLAVVVRPKCSGGAPGMTDDFAERAQSAGLFVLEIDPLA